MSGFYHCSVKQHKRSNGDSATGGAAYRAGTSIKDERTGATISYKNKEEVSHSEMLYNGENPPPNMENLEKFFNGVEQFEKRKDATVGMEVEFSLQNAFTYEQNVELAKEICSAILDLKDGAVGHMSIHAKDGNIHCHFWSSDRPWDEEQQQWGAKVKEWTQKKFIYEARELVANITNAKGREWGYNTNVSHLSNEERGLGLATKHVGLRRENTDILKHNEQVLKHRHACLEVLKTKGELAILQGEIMDTKAELVAAIKELELEEKQEVLPVENIEDVSHIDEEALDLGARFAANCLEQELSTKQAKDFLKQHQWNDTRPEVAQRLKIWETKIVPASKPHHNSKGFKVDDGIVLTGSREDVKREHADLSINYKLWKLEEDQRGKKFPERVPLWEAPIKFIMDKWANVMDVVEHRVKQIQDYIRKEKNMSDLEAKQQMELYLKSQQEKKGLSR